jgi:hypothetical protein
LLKNLLKTSRKLNINPPSRSRSSKSKIRMTDGLWFQQRKARTTKTNDQCRKYLPIWFCGRDEGQL